MPVVAQVSNVTHRPHVALDYPIPTFREVSCSWLYAYIFVYLDNL